MGSDLFVIGVSWRTAAIGLRERLAFSDSEVSDALVELNKLSHVDEVLLISTCNRVEIYGATARSAPASALGTATSQVMGFLSQNRKIASELLADCLYEYTDRDAVRHVFRVASALDSLVVGETQILGQLKAAYGLAVSTGTTGSLLGKCMERAFGVAKRVRNETGVSRGAANVSSVAVELAKRVFIELSGKAVLVIGAGKMSALAARHLRSNGAGTIVVTNRSMDKAKQLAEEIDGLARPWEQLEELLTIADVVITSTGAREPVLTRGLFKKVMRRRRYRSIVVIDIAVPRDADPAVGKLDSVYLFDIDDLERVVQSNLKERAKEADLAGRVVESCVVEFETWLRTQRVVPTIRSLREHFISVARSEVERTISALDDEHTPEQRQKAIRRLGELIAKKLLHQPMTALKASDEQELEMLVTATQRLFSLDTDSDDENSANQAVSAHLSEEQNSEGHA